MTPDGRGLACRLAAAVRTVWSDGPEPDSWCRALENVESALHSSGLGLGFRGDASFIKLGKRRRIFRIYTCIFNSLVICPSGRTLHVNSYAHVSLWS